MLEDYEGEGEDEDDEDEDEEDGIEGEGGEGGDIRRKVQGERVLKSGYLDKKGEKRKVSLAPTLPWLSMGSRGEGRRKANSLRDEGALLFIALPLSSSSHYTSICIYNRPTPLSHHRPFRRTTTTLFSLMSRGRSIALVLPRE
jgi:hypothetical protein